MKLKDEYAQDAVSTALAAWLEEGEPEQWVVRLGRRKFVEDPKHYTERRKRITTDKALAVRFHLWFLRIAIYQLTDREMPQAVL